MENHPKKRSQEDYWTSLAKSDFIPNFFMTPEYAEKADLEWSQCGNLYGWRDKWERGWSFPPLGPKGFETQHMVWAGFADVVGSDILDRLYIYDSWLFNDLTGSRWSIFRKNIRKYPERIGGDLVYRRLEEREQEDEISDMFLKWSEGKEVQDPVVMIRFFLFGKLRWGLFRNGGLVGVNVGDENHRHAVYRYCLDNGSPFLNEYLRYLFYLSEWVQNKRWVNDGGDLDNPKLARFKKKLNPIKIYQIYSNQTTYNQLCI